MKEVYKNLFVGGDEDCRAVAGKSNWATVHACKTCHVRKLGYSGSLPQDHPNYLVLEEGPDLYLNIVDMYDIDAKYTDPMIQKAFQFIDKHLASGNVLIHCNMGASRSPTIAMLYLAKKSIISGSYDQALKEFQERYPIYFPGTGMTNYCKEHWDRLTKHS